MPAFRRSFLALPLVLLVGATVGMPPRGPAKELTLIQHAADPPETTVDLLGAWVADTAARAAQAAGVGDAQLEGGHGVWQFVAFGRPLLVMSDPVAGRMRVMTPVLDGQGQPVPLDPGVATRLLSANFDTALDARYATHGGQLWSVYLHPLPTLTRTDFDSGVLQVLTLAQTYGTTFSSTGFRFGDGDADIAPEDERGNEQTI